MHESTDTNPPADSERPAEGSSDKRSVPPGAASPGGRRPPEPPVLYDSSDSLFEQPAAPAADSQPRQPVLGDYVLLGRIGSGGMGRVFKAQHRRMDRLVALKVLPRAAMLDPAAVQRFHREVRAAARLFHPHIVAAFDAGEQSGIHYLVMEYVDGQSLAQVVEQYGPLPVDKAVDYLVQAGRGLEYAHSRGLIHRDIKPSNLMLDRDGVVKILDLGTARFGDGETSDLTQSGEIMGTVDYMSPEQARSAAELDHRTDIYSLGCTLFYLLAGRPMYAGDTIQTLLAHAQEPAPALRDFRPDVPTWLETVYRRMVAKRPEQRYDNVSQLLAELDEAGSVLPRPSFPDLAAGGTGTAAAGGISTAAASVGASGRLASMSRQVSASRGRPEPVVGIDLGTTYCSLARLDARGAPALVADANDLTRTPSAVLIDGMHVMIGAKALKAIEREQAKVALDVKRTLGLPVYPKTLGESRYPPEALLGLLLARLTDDARRRIGNFRQVVVSVPAWFDEVHRKSVQDAGYIAGLEVVDIVNEPLAAAIAEGFQHDFLKSPGKGDQPVRMLVVDLGGGTLDVTVMEVDESSFRELATTGDLQLGGRDWDNCLVNLVAERCRQDVGLDPRQDPTVSGRLWLQCERARRMLSEHEQVAIDCRLETRTAHVEISRWELEAAAAELLVRLQETVEQAMSRAGLNWDQLDRVLLSGGAGRMPAVKQALLRLAKRKLAISQADEHAVALGAALFAGARQARQQGREPVFRATTVNAHSLGVVGINRRTGRRLNAVLIPRNTPLPASSKSTFKTQRVGQDSVVVQIVQGDDEDADRCTPLGRCVIENLPPDLPAGSPVIVEFHYAANGRLTVFVESQATGYRATNEIVRDAGLSNQALTRWREWVETIVLCSNLF